jgi:hypothetical protein
MSCDRADDRKRKQREIEPELPADSASSTAMRTATPISTCSRISDWAPSATMLSISTPRFIGPGCITSASGLA